MKPQLAALLLTTVLTVSACDGDTGAMGTAGTPGSTGPAGPAGPPGAPAQTDFTALTRAALAQPQLAIPRDINDLDLVTSENPSEFDDLFQ